MVYQMLHSVPASTECTLIMTDSYGDGWNGAEWKAPGMLRDGESFSIEEGLVSIEEYPKVISKTETFYTPPATLKIESPNPPPSPVPPNPPPSPVPCYPEDDTWVESTISVTAGDYPEELSWTLSCKGMCKDIVMSPSAMPSPSPMAMGSYADWGDYSYSDWSYPSPSPMNYDYGSWNGNQ